MNNSIIGSLILIAGAIYLIIRLNKRSASTKYERKPQNNWSALSDGIDPTDE
ncbi:MAG: hypothetical protein NTV41_04025 [Actinobacteria bacterium]|nr:hypothetical protein [Actinomycetota bacterium]